MKPGYPGLPGFWGNFRTRKPGFVRRRKPGFDGFDILAFSAICKSLVLAKLVSLGLGLGLGLANAGLSTGPALPFVPVDNNDGESTTTSLTLQQRMELL